MRPWVSALSLIQNYTYFGYHSQMKDTTLYPFSGCLITPTEAIRYSLPTNSVWCLSILYLIKNMGMSLCSNIAAAASVILHNFLPLNSPPSFLNKSKHVLYIRPSYSPPLSIVKSLRRYMSVVRLDILSNSQVKNGLSIWKRLSTRILRLGISRPSMKASACALITNAILKGASEQHPFSTHSLWSSFKVLSATLSGVSDGLRYKREHQNIIEYNCGKSKSISHLTIF